MLRTPVESVGWRRVQAGETVSAETGCHPVQPCVGKTEVPPRGPEHSSGAKPPVWKLGTTS